VIIQINIVYDQIHLSICLLTI